MSNKQPEIHLRYHADSRNFDFAMGDSVDSYVTFPDKVVPAMVANMEADKAQGADMARLFMFLVNNSRNQPGKWVSASSVPVSNGQAAVES